MGWLRDSVLKKYARVPWFVCTILVWFWESLHFSHHDDPRYLLAIGLRSENANRKGGRFDDFDLHSVVQRDFCLRFAFGHEHADDTPRKQHANFLCTRCIVSVCARRSLSRTVMQQYTARYSRAARLVSTIDTSVARVRYYSIRVLLYRQARVQVFGIPDSSQFALLGIQHETVVPDLVLLLGPALPFSALHRNTALPCISLHHPALPCTTFLHYPALPCTVLHCAELPCSCTTLHPPTLALPCTILHCTTLH